MSAREEQTLELAVRLAYPLRYDDGHLREAEDMILEAERRAEQRARAEIGGDRIPLPTYEAFCNSAKGLMSGEFNLPGPHITCDYCEGSGWEDEEDGIECSECDGAGTHSTTVGVPWTTIKDIYRAIVDEYGPKPAIDAARGVG
ncbi:DnaJ-like cysteine-rich domain-containing protein [Acetobacter lambici]|uniref:Uncharacterized protein n=2 Tax=Acetobacter lambici TaxID=1332824 RepID=A0ABT1EZH6_9PROT|nr:hypothetical protein [Acetobacter lambici]MCP1258351.1 hypothetical protein [Acetobacter lambici]